MLEKEGKSLPGAKQDGSRPLHLKSKDHLASQAGKLQIGHVTNMYPLSIIDKDSNELFSVDGYGEFKVHGEVTKDPAAIMIFLRDWSTQYFENYKASL